MKSKSAFVLLNGKKPKKFPDLSNYDIVCAVDGAYCHFKRNNITPDLITGDFDSIKDLPQNIEIIETHNQDFTDFEKTLKVLSSKGISTIDVFGGSGKEIDHFIGNLSTALKWKKALKIIFYDNHGKYFFLENYFESEVKPGTNISLIPFPSAEGIVTQGLKYPLTNENLVFGSKIGTRNRTETSNISISFKKGNLLIYISS